MPTDPSSYAYDLFVSYAQADDPGMPPPRVSALVEAIRAGYLEVAGRPLSVFFDSREARAMDDWEARILAGLRQSKMMVAILSPAYFASAYCRKEWEAYVETELAHALPGEGILPIYVVADPAFAAAAVEARLGPWLKDLKRRQSIEWRPFWPEGAQALALEDARARLADLPRQIHDRLRRADARDAARNTVPLPSTHFVGRREELRDLRLGLVKGQIGAITAVHGIPGIGKSMLAFAYAWGYGFEYPGGRYLIPAAGATDLAPGVIALAEPLGLVLNDEERRNPEVALARVKATLEAGPPALLVIDNLDDPALLAPQARGRALPRGDRIHLLVTTRVSPDDLPRIRCLPLDALPPDDALALLLGFRPIADAPGDDEGKAALELVQRLGGHALAVEVVGVFLRENPGVPYRQFVEGLELQGITILDEEVGPEVRGRLEGNTESSIARLLAPTLDALSPAERRAVEYAACLPPDNVPLPWLRELLRGDFPELVATGLRDPLAAVFKRLHRLRLVVPVGADRGATPGPGASHLARMHRLVQDVVRSRLGPDEEAVREEAVHELAGRRGDWLVSLWGQVGLAWELPPLRDLALRLIARGDRRGYLLGDAISTPLLHTGRMLDARTLWGRSVSMFQQLCAAHPENVQYARDLSVSHNSLGDLAVAAGDPSAARRHYEDALAIRRRLSEAAPESAEFARDLSIGYERLGDLAVDVGDPSAARRYYEDSMAIWRRLSEGAPEDAAFARGLCVPYHRLGDLALAAGDPSAARRYFQDALAIARRLSEAAPESADFARGLSISYNKLGDLAVAAGDPSAARRYYEDGLAIRRRLSEAAPEDAEYALDLSISDDRLGDMARAAGEAAAARRHYEDALAIRRRLSEAAPESAEYARGLSVSYVKLGDVAVALGEASAARRYYEDALAIHRRLSEAAPESAEFARDLWVSYWRMAEIAEESSDRDDALTWWRQAYDVLSGLKQAGRLVSVGDERYLPFLEAKLGLRRDTSG